MDDEFTPETNNLYTLAAQVRDIALDICRILETVQIIVICSSKAWTSQQIWNVQEQKEGSEDVYVHVRHQELIEEEEDFWEAKQIKDKFKANGTIIGNTSDDHVGLNVSCNFIRSSPSNAFPPTPLSPS